MQFSTGGPWRVLGGLTQRVCVSRGGSGGNTCWAEERPVPRPRGRSKAGALGGGEASGVEVRAEVAKGQAT